MSRYEKVKKPDGTVEYEYVYGSAIPLESYTSETKLLADNAARILSAIRHGNDYIAEYHETQRDLISFRCFEIRRKWEISRIKDFFGVGKSNDWYRTGTVAVLHLTVSDITGVKLSILSGSNDDESRVLLNWDRDRYERWHTNEFWRLMRERDESEGVTRNYPVQPIGESHPDTEVSIRQGVLDLLDKEDPTAREVSKQLAESICSVLGDGYTTTHKYDRFGRGVIDRYQIIRKLDRSRVKDMFGIGKQNGIFSTGTIATVDTNEPDFSIEIFDSCDPQARSIIEGWDFIRKSMREVRNRPETSFHDFSVESTTNARQEIERTESANWDSPNPFVEPWYVPVMQDPVTPQEPPEKETAKQVEITKTAGSAVGKNGWLEKCFSCSQSITDGEGDICGCKLTRFSKKGSACPLS